MWPIGEIVEQWMCSIVGVDEPSGAVTVRVFDERGDLRYLADLRREIFPAAQRHLIGPGAYLCVQFIRTAGGQVAARPLFIAPRELSDAERAEARRQADELLRDDADLPAPQRSLPARELA